MKKPIVALAGGVGAARFLDGLARVVDPAGLWIIGNTADDTEITEEETLNAAAPLDVAAAFAIRLLLFLGVLGALGGFTFLLEHHDEGEGCAG